ncbi:MAG: DUF3667 domain-containing protein [Gammaproteobacteria bacterium]|nr:DUF3667 domain-containing protein [Gammaproteobacteria bacterium]
MAAEKSELERFTADKFCGQCGQKNFRPNRSLGELFKEFVEDWLGYDSKIYKTAAKLIKPAALSLDYFSNSHHKNHYITPIRLYLLLSVVFFLMTQFGGLNVTEVSLDEFSNPASSQEQLKEAEEHLTNAITEAGSEQERIILEQTLAGIKASQQIASDQSTQSQADSIAPDSQEKTAEKPDGYNFTITGDNDFNSKSGCTKDPTQIIDIWPKWLDDQLDKGAIELCDSYKRILYLPEEQQKEAKAAWGLSLAQEAIELIPQTFFLSLPILALVLSIFYFLSRRLYVEHLVLLMHSHSFIFAVILIYLGWFKLTNWIPQLDIIPMGSLFSIGCVVYLYLSQKWFYQRGWWATLWRFLLFGFVYVMLISVILSIAALVGILLGSS